jgi:TonB family protein
MHFYSQSSYLNEHNSIPGCYVINSKWTNDILTITTMKKTIITPFLFLLFISGFSQNLSYEVHGKYTHPVKKEILNNAESMSDIIPYYPIDWILSYVSVEISATLDGKEIMAANTNDRLSTEQKNILKAVDLGSDIVINIEYKSKNSVTGNIYLDDMNYSATVIPEIEAEYPGGQQQMTQYLEENAINKISDTTSGQIQEAIVRFTVNEEGEIADAQVFKTSGDPKTDKLLLKVINKMPKWSPAEDSKGIKVKQEFEFSVGSVGC